MENSGKAICSDKFEVVGLIPAAGKATRINPIPCSKELIPIGLGKIHNATIRPKVVTQYLLEKYKSAGVSKVFFILRKGKWDIPAYFSDGGMMGMDFAYLLVDLPYGVPFTLDQAYPFIGNVKVVMGFPDILFGPIDAFARADQTLIRENADIIIGLYPVKDQRQAAKCDMVQWNARTSRINRIDIKPEFSTLNYSWIFAIWTPVFTEFMHDYLIKKKEGYKEAAFDKEMHLGDVVQHAIDEGLNVFGHAFEENRFIDIGTPDELIEACKEYQDYEGLKYEM